MPSRSPRKKKPSPSSYYYADGKRVPLKSAADLIAVDDARLAAKLPDLLASDAALRAGRPLRGGIRLVERGALSAETLGRLEGAGVTQPVYRAGESVMVALPEVRVEDDSRATLNKAAAAARGKAETGSDAIGGRLTLHPASGDGADAIALANELVEQHDVASASPRFIRVVPGPISR